MGTVITFYSYKGGVGRSLALANVAALLAQWERRVLCVDWDLEAPGLDLYFAPWTGAETRPGLLPLLRADEIPSHTEWNSHVTPVRLPDLRGKLDLISAGSGDPNYVSSLNRMDWEKLYSAHGLGEKIEQMRTEWAEAYDFVLIDSRTGLGDLGGICTIQLPDQLTLFATPNRQCIDGTLEVARRATKARERLPYDRAGLPCIPVASRFDGQVEQEPERWRDEFARAFEPLYARWIHCDVSARALVDFLTIPYKPNLSYGEHVPVMEEGIRVPGSIGFSFATLAALLAHGLGDTHLLVADPYAFVEDAQRLPLDILGQELPIRKVLYLDRRERSLARELRARWRADLAALRVASTQGREAEGLLFPGLQGCVLGELLYIPARPTKIKLREWLRRRDELARVCFVLADAGAGKTNYILSEVDAEFGHDETSPDASPIVLWCALGKLRPSQQIFAAVAETLARLPTATETRVTADTVRSLCRSEPTILVLDGLDELARTGGTHEADRIISDVARELGDPNMENLRIVLGCRSHVYAEHANAWTSALQQARDGEGAEPVPTEIRLGHLDPNLVAKALASTRTTSEHARPIADGLSRDSRACEAAAEVPLLLAAVRQLPITLEELRDVPDPAGFRLLILEKAVGKDRDDEFRELGRLAALMIENRRDYLSDTDLKDRTDQKATIRRHSGSERAVRTWPLLVHESDREWRFVHQSIREYLLAWNIFDGLRGPRERAWLINETTSLDWESGEVYCFVADLLAKDRSAFLDLAENCLSQGRDNPRMWNRMMRNLFEAVGMVGDACCERTRRLTLEAACRVIESPGDGNEARPYANFMTRFNAARCIERLHGSSPRSFCKHWTRPSERDPREFLRFRIYAVRGFQRRKPSISDSPSLPFSKERNGGADPLTEFGGTIVRVLKRELERLLDLPELDQNDEFLAVNLSLAVARWLPHRDEGTKEWLRHHLAKANGEVPANSVPLSRAIAANLELALWYRDEKQHARQKGSIVTANVDLTGSR
jgi:MinD-like ATPase involved in chromosome partitioning or flagellar assembly